jgi:hypothetical protein
VFLLLVISAEQRASIQRAARSSPKPALALQLLQVIEEETTMSNETDRSDKPNLQDNSADEQKAAQEKVDCIADKAAKRGEKREQRYDEEHGIFTK